MSLIIALLLGALAFADARENTGIAEPENSKVHVVDYDNFHRFIRRNELVLMEFYAPWCGHCQELAPKFREAAAELAKMDLPKPVVLAKYDDGDEYNRQLRAGAPDVFNYTAYPALIVFEDGENSYYTGGRETDQIVFHMSALSQGLDPHDEELKARPGLYKKEPGYDPLVMVDLEPEFFDQLVLDTSPDNDVVWIVEFYSDNCPFCKTLKGEFLQASPEVAEALPGKVRFGGINSRIFEEVADRFEVLSWPWVASFYQGEKTLDMAGLGGKESIVRWAKSRVEAHDPAGISPETAAATMAAAMGVEKGVEKLDERKEEVLGELQALLDTALEFGIATEKKVKTAFDRIEAHETTPHKAIRHWTEKMQPLLDLQARLAELEAALAPAAGEKAEAAVAADGTVAVSAAGDTVATTAGDDGRSWREILGSHTWFFLHTVAAKYPEHPTEADKQTIRNLVAALGQHYPCALCREHLQQKLGDPALGAVAVDSRGELSMWFCALHNLVNEDTGKPQHECTPFGLDQIYLKDCGECKKKPKGEGDAGEEEEEEEEEARPWDAILYGRDPERYLTIETQKQMWDAAEVDEMEELARAFNVDTAGAGGAGLSREERLAALDETLRPVLALKAENAKLKKELKKAGGK